MFAYRQRNYKGLLGLIVLTAALLAFGCGDDASSGETAAATTATTEAEQPPDAGEQSGSEADIVDADPGDAAVIEAWIDALSRSDTVAAAELFATPSVAENGPLVSRMRTLDDAIAFNESLPCGGRLVAAQTSGEFTTATFRLTDRPGSSCGGGVGGEAMTSFVITDGKIVEWRRVGTDPGDSGGSTT